MKKTIFAVLLMAVYAQGTIRYCAYNGNDENDGTSRALAVLTLQKGLDVSVGVDSLLVCYDTILSTKTDTVGIKRGGTAPATLTAPFRVIGCDTAGNVRASGYTTIRASASLANGLVWFADSADFTYLQGFDFDGNNSAQYCIRDAWAENVGGIRIVRCEVHSSTSHGIVMKPATSYANRDYVTDCYIHDCGGYGVAGSSASYGQFHISYSYVTRNASGGVKISQTPAYFKYNIVVRNVGHGVTVDAPNSVVDLSNNIMALNTGSGLNIAASPVNCEIENNIIAWNLQGLTTNAANMALYNKSRHNCFWGNTTRTDRTPDTLYWIGNVYSDPLFSDTTAGSEDWSLQIGSPCKNTGVENRFIEVTE